MRNISDEELDKLFREASEKTDYPYDSSAWESMNTRLDAASNVGFDGVELNSGIISSIITVAVLIATFYYFQKDDSDLLKTYADQSIASMEMKESTEIKGEVQELISDSQTERAQSMAIESSRQLNSKELSPSSLSATKEQPKKVLRDNQSQKPETFSSHNLNNEQASSDVRSSINNSNYGERSLLVKNSPSSESEIPSSPSSLLTENSSNDAQRKSSEPIAEDKQVSSVNNREIEKIRSERSMLVKNDIEKDSLVDEIKEQMLKDGQQFTEDEDRDDKRIQSLGKFGIKLSVSPDFTSIGYARPNEVGINYGLLAEYQFFKNWYISTGVIMSRKIYSGENVEYTFSSNTYTADRLAGDCRIIDLPINVYYFVAPQNNFSFFGGIGFTSYIMLQEDYSYTVSGSYGSKDYEKHVEGENNEWFKQLNISIGVQKRFSNHFALQMEPFLKAPLAGVGEGKVSLTSLGAFLNLKYSFSTKTH